MGSANRVIICILAIAAVAIAFWTLALSPKREKADELSGQVSQLEISLAEARGKAQEAETARREFPADYRQLVLLGQAVPASDETASLLVELNHIARRSKVSFESISLSSSGGEVAAAALPAPEVSTPEAASAGTSAVPAAASVPPTEVAASLLPLGATIGPAGLAVMPYTLTFSGDFFHVADFIKGVDSLVDTGGKVSVDGRLITLDGFALTADAERGFPYLNATFSVTTYLTPPSQGVTAGASPSAPAPSTSTPAAETSTPEGSSETSGAPETSETVAAR